MRCETQQLTPSFSDDGLTYCTWNSLGQDLTEEKIFNALDTLAKNGINISNMIIDDGWQSVVSTLHGFVVFAHAIVD